MIPFLFMPKGPDAPVQFGIVGIIIVRTVCSLMMCCCAVFATGFSYYCHEDAGELVAATSVWVVMLCFAYIFWVYGWVFPELRKS